MKRPGATTEQEAIRKEDEAFSPADLKALREREGASRADLAYSLCVSPDTVAQWERGKRRPNGSALRLLRLVNLNGLKYIDWPRVETLSG